MKYSVVLGKLWKGIVCHKDMSEMLGDYLSLSRFSYIPTDIWL